MALTVHLLVHPKDRATWGKHVCSTVTKRPRSRLDRFTWIRAESTCAACLALTRSPWSPLPQPR